MSAFAGMTGRATRTLQNMRLPVGGIMTKLAELAPLFETTAAEIRQRRFDELVRERTNPFSVRAISDNTGSAAELAKLYDRAARRHQLWITRMLHARPLSA
jgi:hypothetical protein